MTHRVFVFGTLKRGFPNHEDLGLSACFVGEATTVEPYPLYVAGRWYSPIVIDEPGRGHPVRGEVYAVDDKLLGRLDDLEYVGQPGGYRRIEIEVDRRGMRERTFTYVKDRNDLDVIHTEVEGDYQSTCYIHWRDRHTPPDETISDIDFFPQQPMTYEDVLVVVDRERPADHSRNWVPSYDMHIYDCDRTVRYGHIGLRVGETENIVVYAGHIGYGIDAPHRGHHRAAKACEAIRTLVRRHYVQVVITCDPDNVASRKTLERIGARYVETIDVPKDSPTHQIAGSLAKARFVWTP